MKFIPFKEEHRIHLTKVSSVILDKMEGIGFYMEYNSIKSVYCACTTFSLNNNSKIVDKKKFKQHIKLCKASNPIILPPTAKPFQPIPPLPTRQQLNRKLKKSEKNSERDALALREVAQFKLAKISLPNSPPLSFFDFFTFFQPVSSLQCEI